MHYPVDLPPMTKLQDIFSLRDRHVDKAGNCKVKHGVCR